jgi:hypothetical protein
MLAVLSEYASGLGSSFSNEEAQATKNKLSRGNPDVLVLLVASVQARRTLPKFEAEYGDVRSAKFAMTAQLAVQMLKELASKQPTRQKRDETLTRIKGAIEKYAKKLKSMK